VFEIVCAGDELSCVMTVNNTGTVGIDSLAAENTACADLPTLAPGESANCTVTLTAQQNDFDAWDAAYTSAGTSTAPLVLGVAVSGTATASMDQTSASDSASVSVPLVSAPAITVVSTATNVSAGDNVRAGG
jgi:hypothetical protein